MSRAHGGLCYHFLCFYLQVVISQSAIDSLCLQLSGLGLNPFLAYLTLNHIRSWSLELEAISPFLVFLLFCAAYFKELTRTVISGLECVCFGKQVFLFFAAQGLAALLISQTPPWGCQYLPTTHLSLHHITPLCNTVQLNAPSSPAPDLPLHLPSVQLHFQQEL